jgi:hypothetical protein
LEQDIATLVQDVVPLVHSWHTQTTPRLPKSDLVKVVQWAKLHTLRMMKPRAKITFAPLPMAPSQTMILTPVNVAPATATTLLASTACPPQARVRLVIPARATTDPWKMQTTANVATRSVMNLTKCFASLPSTSVVAPVRLANTVMLRRRTIFAPSALVVSTELWKRIHLTRACLVQLGNIMAMMTRMQINI